ETRTLSRQCDNVYRLGFLPASTLLLVECRAGDVEMLHVDGYTPLPVVPRLDQFTASLDGKLFAFGGALWDTASGSKVADLAGPAAFSADSRQMAVAKDFGGVVELWAINSK